MKTLGLVYGFNEDKKPTFDKCNYLHTYMYRICINVSNIEETKHYGTRGSQVIPQPSTDRAQPRLTSEF